MFRHILVLLVVSIVGIIWIKEIGHFLFYLTKGYHYIANTIGIVIRGSYIALVARQSITLVLLPLIVAFIPGGIYWLAKRQIMPYLPEIAYITWLVTLTALALSR